MWRQVLDLASAPRRARAPRCSRSRLTTAVKNGGLTDPKSAARKGWLAIANKTNSAGKLDKICPGTGAAPAGTLALQHSSMHHCAGLGDCMVRRR